MNYATDTPGKMHGIPDFLRADTPEKVAARRQAWLDTPPRAMPTFIDKPRTEDPEAAALRAELEAAAAVKTGNRIAKMKAKQETKKTDRTGQRWDARRNKWVPEGQPTSAAKARANQARMEK